MYIHTPEQSRNIPVMTLIGVRARGVLKQTYSYTMYNSKVECVCERDHFGRGESMEHLESLKHSTWWGRQCTLFYSQNSQVQSLKKYAMNIGINVIYDFTIATFL